MDVPVQYFQSVIGIELAVSGALLWQMKASVGIAKVDVLSKHFDESRPS